MAFEAGGIPSSPLYMTGSAIPAGKALQAREVAPEPGEISAITDEMVEKPPSRQDAVKACKGAPAAEEAAPASAGEPQANMIRQLLDNNQEKLLPMDWKKPLAGDAPPPLPCSGKAVTDAFRKGYGVLAGKPGFFSHEVRMVEVGEPESLGKAAELLVSLAGQERGLMRREYGLMYYSNDRGEGKFFVERGTAAIFTPELHKYRAIETPDGTQWLLLGCVGHTHPFSSVGNPSDKDIKALHNGNAGIDQRFSIVAARGGWHLFNGQGAYDAPPEVLSRPITGLLEV
jgi:hypothetical protein